jgi:ribosome maturation factor RimP
MIKNKRGSVDTLPLSFYKTLKINILYKMIEQQLEEIIFSKFEEPEFSEYFLIEINLPARKNLEIIIDADKGVTFDKCQRLSRYVENWLDTEGVLGDDYTIEVSSPGVDRSLKLARQYPKHIGRTLEVLDTEGGKYAGVLKSVEQDQVVLSYEEIRLEGKKKIKETVIKKIPLESIKTAFVKISF